MAHWAGLPVRPGGPLEHENRRYCLDLPPVPFRDKMLIGYDNLRLFGIPNERCHIGRLIIDHAPGSRFPAFEASGVAGGIYFCVRAVCF